MPILYAEKNMSAIKIQSMRSFETLDELADHIILLITNALANLIEQYQGLDTEWTHRRRLYYRVENYLNWGKGSWFICDHAPPERVDKNELIEIVSNKSAYQELVKHYNLDQLGD